MNVSNLKIAGLTLLACGFTLFPLRLRAENQTNLPAPALREVSAGVFDFGQIRIHKAARSVSFPARVGLREGTIEYAVVHQRGKTHESVFQTDTEPQHIHLAMLLLGVKAANTNAFSADLKIPPPGEAVTVLVQWKVGEKETTRRIEEFVLNKQTKKTSEPGPWSYNGSHVYEGTFIAQRDGSIVSTHIDPDALVNNPRPGRENDDLFTVNPAALPPVGTNVQVILQLQPVRAPEKTP